MSTSVDAVDRRRRLVAIVSSLLPALTLSPAHAAALNGAPGPSGTPAAAEQLGNFLLRDAQVQELTLAIVNSLPAATEEQFEQLAQLVASGATVEEIQQFAHGIVVPKETLQLIDELVTAGSYVMGLGLALFAIKKFKAHKDNPTQIPIGTPIALVFIAAALLFLPSILESSGESLFSS